jgi:hypothetical protein
MGYDACMSIGKRIEETVARMAANDADAALIPMSIAVASTAQLLYPTKKDNQAYKRFVSQNLGLISRVAFSGTAFARMHVSFSHPSLKPASDGTVTIEQVLYHVVRCGLLHSAALPNGLRFENGTAFLVDPTTNTLVLPAQLIFGLLIAVVVSPVNASQRVDDSCLFNYRGNQIKLNSLWGNRSALDSFLARPRTATC